MCGSCSLFCARPTGTMGTPFTRSSYAVCISVTHPGHTALWLIVRCGTCSTTSSGTARRSRRGLSRPGTRTRTTLRE
eukprot:232937-Prorocentrum_lima.AAC.1